MRRVLGLAAAAVALLAVVVALTAAGGSGGSGDRVRVDAIFDNGGFLTTGQDVKIAGARAGSVKAIHLTPDHKARVEMEVDKRFAPFRSDADCTIQPQSLIGEKFVQCMPGTTRGTPLRATGGHAPTVPLSNTHSPIDLDLVLGTFREPTTTRLSLLLSGLGAGLTGRAGDLNATLRRADPAFAETNRLLGVVNGQRQTIQGLIRDSDAVLGRLAARREDVARFVTEARRATDATTAHQADLRRTLRGLPPLLAEAQPALVALQRLGQQGAPVAAQLQTAAPAATALVRRLSPFAREATPTLTALGPTARTARGALQTAAPQVRRLRRFAVAARPAGAQLAGLFESMRDTGTVEGVLRFVYALGTTLARYDSVSHILPAYAMVRDTCNLYATVTVKSCDAHFATGGATARAKTRRGHRPTGGKDAPAASAPSAPAPGATPEPLRKLLPPQVTKPVENLTGAVQKLVDGLLGQGQGKSGDAQPPGSDGAKGLLDFLLGGR